MWEFLKDYMLHKEGWEVLRQEKLVQRMVRLCGRKLCGYSQYFNYSPIYFSNLENTDVKIFFDAGNVWGVDYSNTIDESNKLRSSTGVALEFLSPVGPLSFSFAETITKASTDVTESFRFQLGTTF